MKQAIRAITVCAVLTASSCVVPYAVRVPIARGQVVDGSDREPIAGAIVALLGYPKTGTITGADGRYEPVPLLEWHVFSMPMSDRLDHHELMVTATSYERQTLPVMSFRGKDVEVDRIPDPDASLASRSPVPPRICSAPVIERLTPVEDPRP